MDSDCPAGRPWAPGLHVQTGENRIHYSFPNKVVFISYSPERLQNIIGIAASHIINVILPPPSPFPKATQRVFVLCTFKVSSSNRKQIGNYKKEAQFYWLSDQKYGMHQGSGRSRGVCGLQSAEAGVCCGEEGQGTGAAHICLCLSSLPTCSAPQPRFPHSWSWALVLWAETQSEVSFPSLELWDSAEGKSLRTGRPGLGASCPLLPFLMFD